jgi:hypothetical protein
MLSVKHLITDLVVTVTILILAILMILYLDVHQSNNHKLILFIVQIIATVLQPLSVKPLIQKLVSVSMFAKQSSVELMLFVDQTVKGQNVFVKIILKETHMIVKKAAIRPLVTMTQIVKKMKFVNYFLKTFESVIVFVAHLNVALMLFVVASHIKRSANVDPILGVIRMIIDLVVSL